MSRCFQENFPALAKLPYPGWIYAIIFILSGVPALVIPAVALYKLIRNRCCGKKEKDAHEKPFYSISDKIQMPDETDKISHRSLDLHWKHPELHRTKSNSRQTIHWALVLERLTRVPVWPATTFLPSGINLEKQKRRLQMWFALMAVNTLLLFVCKYAYAPFNCA